MKKIALTLVTAAGVVALGAGPASAATPTMSAANNAMAQAQYDSLQRIEQMSQSQMDAGSKMAALEANSNALATAQAAAKAMKDATDGYASYAG
jgi:hypothetical protein